MEIVNAPKLEMLVGREQAKRYLATLVQLVPYRNVQSTELTLKGKKHYCKRKTWLLGDCISKLQEYVDSTTLYKSAYASKPHKRKLIRLLKEIQDEQNI